MSSPAAAVLLVDDDRCIRQMLTSYLNRNGYEVSSAIDGYEAMTLVGDGNYRGIILDMMMPRVDGMQFLDWLRNDQEMDIPVVVLTGVVGKTDKDAMLAAGASMVLNKPVSPSQLIDSLREQFV